MQRAGTSRRHLALHGPLAGLQDRLAFHIRRRGDPEEIERGGRHVFDARIFGKNRAIAKEHAGHKVRICEAHHTVGGAAVTEEFAPGFRNSVASYTVSLLQPRVIADMALERRGLRVVNRPVANFLPISTTPGDYLLMGGGLKRSQAELAKFSRKDAETLPAYFAALDE